MKKIIIIGLALFISCSAGKELKNFESDGCSLFIDRSLINEEDWCQCCFEHDVLYWQGGTKEQRQQADEALRDCVLKKTKNEKLAQMMYSGVRFGGSPYFYNWYRWGYGWNDDRKYQELSPAEKKLIKKKLEQYFKDQPENPCSN